MHVLVLHVGNKNRAVFLSENIPILILKYCLFVVEILHFIGRTILLYLLVSNFRFQVTVFPITVCSVFQFSLFDPIKTVA